MLKIMCCLFASGIPWAFVFGAVLFNISMHGFDNETACICHKITDDIQMQGAVIVLDDMSAVGVTLTS